MRTVLSLFDGISGARVALDRAGIRYDKYYASEIDKYAIKISQKNHPDIIQIGDVTKITKDSVEDVWLLVGGSPCQGFSNAGAKLNFDDPRSVLFFEYVRLLRETKPKWFLLENVKMKKEWQDIISEQVGVQPIRINSALVSAQNRDRLYWTNIPDITQPEDRGILLRDVIEDGVVDREKSHCVDADYYKGGSLKMYREKSRRQLVFRQPENRLMVRVGTADDVKGHDYNKRVYSVDGKSPSLAAKSGGNLEPKIAVDETTWRKLTVTECERLQTYPDGYTDGVSNTQRYKALGNSFTVDVIAHIFSFIPDK